MSSIKVALLVVAAGRGLRLGAERPKQYLNCAGRPLLAHTVEALAAGWSFSAATIAIHPDDRALYDEAMGRLTPAAAAVLGPPVTGGETRLVAGERPPCHRRRAERTARPAHPTTTRSATSSRASALNRSG